MFLKLEQALAKILWASLSHKFLNGGVIHNISFLFSFFLSMVCS